MSGTDHPTNGRQVPSAEALDLIAVTEAGNELMTLHRELAQQEALLRAANDRKDDLLTMVAHDLRNPLSTISGFSKTLQHRLAVTLAAQDELLLRRIDAQAQRMLQLVDDLLELAVIQRGRFELALEDVDLHALLEEIVATQAAAADRKGILIELAAPDGPVSATLDRYRMAQVLDNLLSNATKYTVPGTGATITVWCSRDDTSVRIGVEDQGIGIDVQLLPHLFEPFVRSGAGGTDGEPSAGLGLAICRSIVEAHGGTIEVASEAGRGSSFEVVLPANPVSE